jgi:hypothetical protein
MGRAGGRGHHLTGGDGVDEATAARFWAKIQKTDTCWLWTGTKTRGYGRFWLDNQKTSAHRFAYELLVGPIPEGLTIDHLCRVRHCVRPDHLEPVSNRTNTLRGEGRSAVNARKTHCPKGHEYDASNAANWGGRRYCRICNRVKKLAQSHSRERGRAGPANY